MKRFDAAYAAFAAALLVGVPAVAAAQAQDIPRLEFARAYSQLSFRRPVAMLQAPGDSTRWYVVEQGGRVLTFADSQDVSQAEIALDFGDQVDDAPNEAGLLELAFDPQFETSRAVFLSYTRPGGVLTSVIARFTVSADGLRIDPASERVVLTLAQPYGNHNGGGIAFGPDGYLYIGFGDGGSGGDPHGHGQNTGTLLGAMLRIDVDADGGLPYAIPPDNPFATGGGRGEIFAWGLRNPWRWSFDRETGDLWAGDVGQDEWEEIDLITAGGNYGWNRREGGHPFGDAREAADLTDPVAEYSHRRGCSVTGGYVYRGSAAPQLQGVYLYGDYCGGVIWGMRGADGEPQIVAQTGLLIGSFAQGLDGELYALDHRRGGIYRLGTVN